MKTHRMALGLSTCALLASCSAEHGPPHPSFWAGEGCDAQTAYVAAARYNAAALEYLVWSPFGRPERGWAIYAPRLQQQIATHCAPDSPGFAARLAHWQARQALPATGAMDPTTFAVVKAGWQKARPFFVLRARGVCPASPPDRDLIALPADETYDGKTILLRRRAGAALRRLLAAARRAVPTVAQGPERLAAFSGYRSPAYDAGRCARDGDCDGVGRAVCSSHRTGLAVDLVLGAARGYPIDSSADANRLFQSQTPAYRWMISNAGRFGFVNYPFEPWHWEWTGES